MLFNFPLVKKKIICLDSTGNDIQYPVTNHNGKEYEKEYTYIYTHTHTHIYVCVCITESFCCAKEINRTLEINYTSITFLKKSSAINFIYRL